MFPKFSFLKTIFNDPYTCLGRIDLAKTGRDEIEDIILQALSHKERRGILKIIGATPGGVTYSSILGETELNTGHLNYHLRSLEGLIEKADGLYRLTPLGAKALNVIPTLSQDVDNGMLPYVESARSTKQGLLHPVAKGLIYIGIAANGIVFLAGLVFFIMAFTGGGVLSMLLAGAMMLFSGVVIWVLASWLRSVPEFMRRVERMILK
jgi:hypothetical protein